jgi:transposase
MICSLGAGCLRSRTLLGRTSAAGAERNPAPRQRQTAKPDKAEFVVCESTIENTFAKLKDWRRIATRYDRCAHTFFSAICIAAAVAFYLN